MYDDLINRLREAAKISEALAVLLPHSEGNATAKLYKEAADAIEELMRRCEQFQYMPPPAWIPVTERLPEEHVFVLIRQDDDRMMVAVRVDGDWWYRYFAYDVDRWSENEQGTITHWMPLPQPPEE